MKTSQFSRANFDWHQKIIIHSLKTRLHENNSNFNPKECGLGWSFFLRVTKIAFVTQSNRSHSQIRVPAIRQDGKTSSRTFQKWKFVYRNVCMLHRNSFILQKGGKSFNTCFSMVQCLGFLFQLPMFWRNKSVPQQSRKTSKASALEHRKHTNFVQAPVSLRIPFGKDRKLTTLTFRFYFVF